MNFESFYKATSPTTFEIGWHHKLIFNYLERFERRKIKNLMILTPPQHGKSTTVAERFPAYHFSRDPRSHVLVASYSDDLAVRASINCRQIVQSDWFQERFGYPVGKATESRWTLAVPEQDGRYSLVASGISGSITGHTAQIAIIDDVLRSRQDALSEQIRETIKMNYTGSVETRLPKDGGTLLITTRWHADDLAGFLLTRAKDNPKAAQWVVLTLPATNDSGTEAYILNTATGERTDLPAYDALWPSLFPRDLLDQRRADLGEGLWQALYMCRPSMGGNVLFPADKWRVFDNVQPMRMVQAWDCAAKTGSGHDYSACVTVAQLGSGEYAVLDVWRHKVAFPELKQMVFRKWMEMYERWQVASEVVIEDANVGAQLLQEIEHINAMQPSMIYPVAAKPGGKSKYVRAEAIASYQNRGLVGLPSNAPWRQMFINELQEFPLSQNDDMCDAYVYAQAAFVRGEGFFKAPELETQFATVDPVALLNASPMAGLDDLEAELENSRPQFELLSPATMRAIRRSRGE
jgi:predicted phage terminase large subunit-like protein